MVIAKVLSGSTPVTFKLANFTRAVSYSAGNSTLRTRSRGLADIAPSGQSLSTTVPAQSVTLFGDGAARRRVQRERILGR